MVVGVVKGSAGNSSRYVEDRGQTRWLWGRQKESQHYGSHLCCQVASLHTESKPWKSERGFKQPEERPAEEANSTAAASGLSCRVLDHFVSPMILCYGERTTEMKI